MRPTRFTEEPIIRAIKGAEAPPANHALKAAIGKNG